MTTTYRSIVLDGDDLIPDGADSTIIRGGWRVWTDEDRVMFMTPGGQDLGIDAQTARSLGAALVQHSVRAGDYAGIQELADVLARHGYPMGGADRIADARAVWAAGYRKQVPDAQV